MNEINKTPIHRLHQMKAMIDVIDFSYIFHRNLVFVRRIRCLLARRWNEPDEDREFDMLPATGLRGEPSPQQR